MNMMEKAKKMVAPAVAALLVNGAVISTQANAGVLAGAGIIAAASGSKSTGAKVIGAGAGTLVMGAGIGFGVYFLTLIPVTPIAVLGSAFIVLDDKSVNEISKNLPFVHPSEMSDIKELINKKLEGFTADDEIIVNVEADEIIEIMEQGDYTDAEINSAINFFDNL